MLSPLCETETEKVTYYTMVSAVDMNSWAGVVHI